MNVSRSFPLNRKTAQTASVFLLSLLLLAGLGGCAKGGGGGAGADASIKVTSQPPSAPAILVPSQVPNFASNDGTLVISGSCLDGNNVILAEDSAPVSNTTCSGSHYNFSIPGKSDGTYNFALTQVTVDSVVSSPASLKWTKITVAPSAPSISLPVSSPISNSSSSLAISGSCGSGNTVSLSGSSTQSAVCTGGAFSFNVSESSDAVYNFSINQSDIAGNVSPSVSQQWVRDTVAPAAVVLATPTTGSSFSSGDTTLSISGSCEDNANVSLTGADVLTSVCVASSFNFSVTHATDGTYVYSISQADQAGNVSAAVPFTWTRSTAIPATPVIASPATPYHSNTNSVVLVVSGCTDGNPVELNGDDIGSATCGSVTSGEASFTINKSSPATKTFNFDIVQVNPVGPVVSAPVSFQWVRNTVAPVAPTIALPAASPFYSNSATLALSGSCITGNRVNVVASGLSSQNTNCLGSAYSFNLSAPSDGTYNIDVTQTDLEGNSSVAASTQWVLDRVIPSAPVIGFPTVSPYYSKVASVVLSGTCTAGNKIVLSHDDSQQVTCGGGGTFSFAISKTVDGTYSFVLSAQDLAGNSSPTVTTQWALDRVAPSAIVLSSPISGHSYSSGANTVNLAGSCESSATVDLYLDSTLLASKACVGGAFAFNSGEVNQTSDAAYAYHLYQTDLALNQSVSFDFNWTRNNSLPATPVIVAPAVSPKYTNGDALTVSGSCVDTYTVNLTVNGGAGQTTVCASSSFSFNVAQAEAVVLVAGTSYDIAVTQTNPSNSQTSGAASIQWIRKKIADPSPVISSPAVSPIYTNGNLLTISGSCISGDTVHLDGADQQSVLCTGGGYAFYAFNVSSVTDGTFNFSVYQTDLAGNNSSSTSVAWVRDTSAPLDLVLSAPSSNPYTSGNQTINLGGSCESGATVVLSGAASSSVVCSASAFSFSLSPGGAGTYNYSLKQTDLAGNASPSLAFQWVIDLSKPAMPAITVPSLGGSVDYFSTVKTPAFSGTCTTGFDVNIYSSDPADDTLIVCSGGVFAYTALVTNKADGIYTYNVTQTSNVTGVESAAVVINWNVDTSNPATPTISTPSASPYHSTASMTLSGGCEDFATVTVTGTGAPAPVVCAGSAYSFNVSTGSDGTYNYTVKQTDRAGNSSGNASMQWIRNSTVPANPTMASPVVGGGAYISNTANLTITGGCTDTYTVTIMAGTATTLAGSDIISPAGSLTQICSGSSYSFTLTKPAGLSNFKIKQTTPTAIDSAGTVDLAWTKDITVPLVSVMSAKPSNPNLSTAASFTFTAADNVGGSGIAKIECSVDGGAFAACTSPVNLTPANGSRSFAIRATDKAGNVEASPVSYTWTQAAYNAIALYHLDTATGNLVDSSGYGPLFTTTMTNTGTATFPAAKFSEGVLSNGTSQYLQVPHNAAHALIKTQLTAEAFVKFAAAPTTYHPIISKHSKTSGQYGWELGIRLSSTTYYIYFMYALSGTAKVRIYSTALTTAQVSALTAGYNHVAVVADSTAKTVNFYLNGAAVGASTMAAGGTFFNNSTTPLKIGSGFGNSTTTQYYMNGTIDEARVSQIKRYTGAFTAPTAAFSQD